MAPNQDERQDFVFQKVLAARRRRQYTATAPDIDPQSSIMGSEKKRKRQEQGGERPSKKAAIAPVQGNVEVEYIDNDEMLGPIIGVFLASGYNIIGQLTVW